MSLEALFKGKNTFYFLNVEEYEKTLSPEEKSVLSELGRALNPMVNDNGAAYLYSAKMTNRNCKHLIVRASGGTYSLEEGDADTSNTTMTTQNKIFTAFKTIVTALDRTDMPDREGVRINANRKFRYLMESSCMELNDVSMKTVFELLVLTHANENAIVHVLQYYDATLKNAVFTYVRYEYRQTVLLKVCEYLNVPDSVGTREGNVAFYHETYAST